MSESNQPITMHITRREQVALGLALLKLELPKGPSERQKKTAAFAELGLDWVRLIAEEPLDTSVDIVRVFDAAVDAGQEKPTALRSVVDAVLQLRDAFAGKRTSEQVVVTVSRQTSAWVLEKLDGATVGGLDDFAIAELEDRIASARRGDYKLPASLAGAIEEKAA